MGSGIGGGIIDDDETIVVVVLLEDGLKVGDVAIGWCIIEGGDDHAEGTLFVFADRVLALVVGLLLSPQLHPNIALQVSPSQGLHYPLDAHSLP